MSLWTPGGEHEVPRERPATTAPSGPPAGADPSAGEPQGVSEEQLLAALAPEDRAQLAAMGPEERARALAAIQEMVEVQQQMATTPAAVVVANHAMGMYELATIHLRQAVPNFSEAQVAIDGFAALVDALQGKLGEDEATLVNALTQIRMAFVQLKAAADAGELGPQDA